MNNSTVFLFRVFTLYLIISKCFKKTTAGVKSPLRSCILLTCIYFHIYIVCVYLFSIDITNDSFIYSSKQEIINNWLYNFIKAIVRDNVSLNFSTGTFWILQRWDCIQKVLHPPNAILIIFANFYFAIMQIDIAFLLRQIRLEWQFLNRHFLSI